MKTSVGQSIARTTSFQELDSSGVESGPTLFHIHRIACGGNAKSQVMQTDDECSNAESTATELPMPYPVVAPWVAEQLLMGNTVSDEDLSPYMETLHVHGRPGHRPCKFEDEPK